MAESSAARRTAWQQLGRGRAAVRLSASHCSVRAATRAETDHHGSRHWSTQRAEAVCSRFSGVLVRLRDVPRSVHTHQEPIIVARQLDWRVVEPPRHAAEVLGARLPVGRPAHEAALQQHISAWFAVAPSGAHRPHRPEAALRCDSQVHLTWSMHTSVSMWQLWCARLRSLMAGGWQPGASHSSVCI